ncbi:hypothetical protein PPROV_000213700 [Pycnococcus provasolii]|uniref:Uncharacterized protein n=1 Tax=Pycnococcus provasolii TaxID=41880 RepID=A0A830H9T4_9CHLO|nr:hypothetical protein PPROV_000213700 [Pycnococcus provasolii]
MSRRSVTSNSEAWGVSSRSLGANHFEDDDGYDDAYVVYGTRTGNARYAAQKAFRTHHESAIPRRPLNVDEGGGFAPVSFVSSRKDKKKNKGAANGVQEDRLREAEALMDDDEAMAHRARRVTAHGDFGTGKQRRTHDAVEAILSSDPLSAGKKLLNVLGYRRTSTKASDLDTLRPAHAVRARQGLGYEPYRSRGEEKLFERKMHTTRKREKVLALPGGSAFGDDGDDPYADAAGDDDLAFVEEEQAAPPQLPQPPHRLALPHAGGGGEDFIAAEDAAAALAEADPPPGLARDVKRLGESLAAMMRAVSAAAPAPATAMPLLPGGRTLQFVPAAAAPPRAPPGILPPPEEQPEPYADPLPPRREPPGRSREEWTPVPLLAQRFGVVKEETTAEPPTAAASASVVEDPTLAAAAFLASADAWLVARQDAGSDASAAAAAAVYAQEEQEEEEKNEEEKEEKEKEKEREEKEEEEEDWRRRRRRRHRRHRATPFS